MGVELPDCLGIRRAPAITKAGKEETIFLEARGWQLVGEQFYPVRSGQVNTVVTRLRGNLKVFRPLFQRGGLGVTHD